MILGRDKSLHIPTRYHRPLSWDSPHGIFFYLSPGVNTLPYFVFDNLGTVTTSAILTDVESQLVPANYALKPSAKRACFPQL